MVLKQLLFQKITKNRPLAAGGKAPRPPMPPAAGGSALRPPSIIRLSYSTLLYSTHVSHVKHFHILNTGLGPPPLNECVVTCQHKLKATASDLPFYDIFAPRKFPLLKLLMTSLHVICGLGPPN